MKGIEYYSMINEEINRMLDIQHGLTNRFEKVLIHKAVRSLVRLRTNFVQFIECDSQETVVCDSEYCTCDNPSMKRNGCCRNCGKEISKQ